MAHKHQNQWKRIWMGMLAIVLLFSVPGCHQQRKNRQNNQQVSDEVSDEFWQQAQEEIEEKTEVFSNGDNSYCITTRVEGEEMVYVLTQQRADGTLVQNHVIDQLESLIQVSDSYVYYTTWESAAGFRLFWRVPIQKTESGDRLIWEKNEVLLRDIEVSYVTDSYVIYEKVEGIYKLDLRNKAKLPVTVGDRQLGGSVVHGRERKTVVLDGKLFVLDGNSMYSLEPDSAAVKQIYTGAGWQNEDIFYENAYLVSDDNSIYFTCDNETIWQYRQGEEQAVCAITQEDFSEKLKEFGLKKEKDFQNYCISGIILYQERIYLLLRGENTGLYNVDDRGMCLLSTPISDLSKLGNESALTEYLNTWESGAESADTVSDDAVLQAMYVYKPNRIAGIVDGKLVLESVRLSARFVSSIHSEYCAAYDIASHQVLERSGIRKVIP